jgi:hypothetical protein
MTYKQTLELARQHDISPLKLDIAYELHCISDLDTDDDTFEAMCYLIERAYLKSEDLSVYHLTNALLEMSANTPLDEISVYTLINKACY